VQLMSKADRVLRMRRCLSSLDDVKDGRSLPQEMTYAFS